MRRRRSLSNRFSKRNFRYTAAKLDKRNLGGHTIGGFML